MAVYKVIDYAQCDGTLIHPRVLLTAGEAGSCGLAWWGWQVWLPYVVVVAA